MLDSQILALVETMNFGCNTLLMVDLLCKPMDWFLYDSDLRHERVIYCSKALHLRCLWESCLPLWKVLCANAAQNFFLRIDAWHKNHKFLKKGGRCRCLFWILPCFWYQLIFKNPVDGKLRYSYPMKMHGLEKVLKRIWPECFSYAEFFPVLKFIRPYA